MGLRTLSVRVTYIHLFVFSRAPEFAGGMVAAGAAGVVVDWERRGKHRRQAGADTQINADTPDDLARLRAATNGRILCRVNAWGPGSEAEIKTALSLGADEILLPMVRSPEEVEAALGVVDGRRGLGILIETQEAVQRADELLRCPLSRIYVGLNDLMIDRGADRLFMPLVDGTVEHLRRRAGAAAVPFGVAGLTLPDAGHPVPCRLLIAELARLEVSFTFLRRSFHADVAGRDPAVEVPRILAALDRARRRPARQVLADHDELRAAVMVDAEPQLV